MLWPVFGPIAQHCRIKFYGVSGEPNSRAIIHIDGLSRSS